MNSLGVIGPHIILFHSPQKLYKDSGGLMIVDRPYHRNPFSPFIRSGKIEFIVIGAMGLVHAHCFYIHQTAEAGSH